MCDRRVLALLLVFGCGDTTPRIAPSVIDVDEQGPLRIEGLAPDDFLHANADTLVLAGDWQAAIGGIATTVTAASASGVTVTTDSPLAVGTHALELHANGNAWFVDGALDVVEDLRPDATDARVCPTAPTGCTAFQCASTSSCYYVCEKKTASSASAQCGAQAIGCLVTIGDEAENECIANATQPAFPDLIWTGYTQTSTQNEPLGGWNWLCADGTSYVAPNWGQFEPNDDDGDEDCGAMGANGVWIDGDCTTSLRFVCELP